MSRRGGPGAPHAARTPEIPDALGRLSTRLPSQAVLGGGAAAIAVVMALTGLQVTALASLDETVYKLSAVNFVDDFPAAVATDPVARGTARLYSLLIAPLFALFDAPLAIRLARALNGVLWATTAVPVYLIARTVVRSKRLAMIGALLSIAVPWVTLSAVLFSESLSYLLFATTVVAMLAALRQPSWWRDIAVGVLMVALLGTRVQFIAVPVAWVLAVVSLELRRTGVDGRRPEPLRQLAGRSFARFPLTLGGAALVIAVALLLLVTGQLRTLVAAAFGPYSELQNRTTLPSDVGLAALFEVGMLALGVGLVPAMLAYGWSVTALGRRAGEPAFRLALLAVMLIATLFAVTILAQGGWLDHRSEERYYIYAVPLLWIGAVAALEQKAIPARRLVGAGIALAIILFLVPITVTMTSEQAFLGPVSGVLAHAGPRLEDALAKLLGVDQASSTRDIAGYVALLVVLAVGLLWRRGPRARHLVLVPALVLQLSITGYALGALRGTVDGITGITGAARFEEQGWLDRAAGGRPVTLMEGQQLASRDNPLATLFWNDALRARAALASLPSGPPAFPADALPLTRYDLDDDLRLRPAFDGPLVLSDADSPVWQLAGDEIVRSPDRTSMLLRPRRPSQVVWAAKGLDSDGQVTRGVELRAAPGHRITIQMEAPGPEVDAASLVRLGEQSLAFDTARASSSRLTVDLCDARAPVAGSIAVRRAGTTPDQSRFSAGLVRAVRVGSC